MLPPDFDLAWSRCALQVTTAGTVEQAHTPPSHPGGRINWFLLAVIGGAVRVTAGATGTLVRAPGICLVPPGSSWRRDILSRDAATVHIWFHVFTPPCHRNPLEDLDLPRAVTPRDPGPWRERLAAVTECYRAWRKRDEVPASRVHYRLGELLCDHLVDGFAAGTYAAARFGTAAPTWLRQAVQGPVATATEHRWTVAGLARRAGVSPAYLARVFRRHYGTSPSAFLRRERVGFAVQQLRCGHWESVEQAAREMGYPDARLFWRHCVRETGRPPREWLREDGAAS